MSKKNQLLLAFQKVLLFNVTSTTRLITAEVQNENKLVIWVDLDRMPTEDEKDLYYSVSAEITGDFTYLDDSISEVNFSTEKLDDKELKGKLVLFARCDFINSEGELI